MKKNTKAIVFKLIEGERSYQDKRWTQYDDSKWKPADWLNFIKEYIRRAEEGTYESDCHEAYEMYQMEQIRKIGALAVAAMEHNLTPARE